MIYIMFKKRIDTKLSKKTKNSLKVTN